MTGEPAQAVTGRSGPLPVLGWGAYLACSWTWCIGMFLPVLLVRDFGAWGYAVFAAPNVAGAAAMGWVLRRQGASEWLVQRHGGMCRLFSIVTVAFQFMFLYWMAGANSATLARLLYLSLLSIIVWAYGPGWAVRAALVCLLVSLVALGVFLGTDGAHIQSAAPALPRGAVVFLAPVSVFGFSLCPYLDLTFHEARQRLSPGAGVGAFALGFGVFFVAMILFTLAYSGLAMGGLEAPLTAVLPPIVSLHILVQLFFTLTVHAQQTSRGHWALLCITLMAAGLLVLGISSVASIAARYTHGGLGLGEIGYRLFMAFYALVFPAYVWVCVIPTRDGHSGPSRHKLRVWAAAVGVAAPMFWMGFIERQTWWLAPGLAVLLLSRLAVLRRAT